ncbi:MAG: DinB family protein [Chryseolinea sp.]
MTHPDLAGVPPFYMTYVEYVKDDDMMDILHRANVQAQELIKTIPEEKGTFRYAEGKWTIKEVLCHMMDAERIFAYRALRFSRNDKTPLPGFDENSYAPESNAHSRTVEQIALEMTRLRQSTLDLYNSFSADMLLREGIATKTTLSVLNLGFIIPGHESHHCKILRERYLQW